MCKQNGATFYSSWLVLFVSFTRNFQTIVYGICLASCNNSIEYFILTNIYAWHAYGDDIYRLMRLSNIFLR